ncbi:hypothetical protein OOK40_25905 [Streptomyces sp. NBC_01481]|nr:hypothetical protein [Streptomyces sp. NBC_01481]MCX4586381.1 hypothetical protein [Streptomyces sp. NBC_01481]
MSAVVGERGDGQACAAVGRVTEGDGTGLAGGFRDRDDAGFGDELLAGLGAFEDGAEFADDLGGG